MRADLTATRTFTVVELAERWRVSSDKVRLWISNGELQALDIATRGSKRPRWRISQEAVARFELSRQAPAASPPTPRRSFRDKPVKSYF